MLGLPHVNNKQTRYYNKIMETGIGCGNQSVHGCGLTKVD